MPIYEEHEARLERGIDLKTWGDMEEAERALVIAARRIGIAIRNLQAEAEIRQADANARKHRR